MSPCGPLEIAIASDVVSFTDSLGSLSAMLWREPIQRRQSCKGYVVSLAEDWLSGKPSPNDDPP